QEIPCDLSSGELLLSRRENDGGGDSSHVRLSSRLLPPLNMLSRLLRIFRLRTTLNLLVCLYVTVQSSNNI
ncbi:hypothetical protein J6590_071579, partial [Homalodisca vitripennis]